MKVRLKKALSLLLSLIMILGCMSLPAFAAETADSNEAVASATPTGGETKYYTTLQEAINAAFDGGTVELLKNVEVEHWHQNLWCDTQGPQLYDSNAPGYKRQPTAGPKNLTIIGGGHSLTIQNVYDSGKNGSCILARAENLTVENLTITIAKGNGIGIKSGRINNVIFNINGTTENRAIYTNGNTGVGDDHIEITNCTFNSTTDGTFAIYSVDEGTENGTIISGNTFNTTRSIALRSDTKFLNNVVNGAKGVTIAGNATDAVVRGNYFAETNTSRSINIYPAPEAVIDGNVILGKIELETDKLDGGDWKYQYTVAPDLSGNYWGGGAPANLPPEPVTPIYNSYYTTYTAHTPTEEDGSLFTLSNPVTYVAQIGSTKYETLAAAITAAQAGNTVKLLDNVTEAVTISGKTLTLDLNGFNITSTTTAQPIKVDKGTKLTIMNSNTAKSENTATQNAIMGPSGKINKGSLAADGKDTTVDIYAGYYYGYNGNKTAIHAINGATVTFYGGVVNGKEAINDTTAGKEGKVFYSGTNGNTFAAVNGKESPGKIIVKGGEFHGRMSNSSWGNYEIYGGTFDRDQVISYFNPTVGGEIVSVAAYKDANPTVALPTPSTKSDNDKKDSYAIADATDSAKEATISMEEAGWLAEGYAAYDNGNDTYTVAKAGAVAKIDNVYYDTLAEAFDAAQDNDTVTLVKDCDCGTQILLLNDTRTLILDLGGKTLSGRINLKRGDLTIRNGIIAHNQPLNVYGSETEVNDPYTVLTIEDDVTIKDATWGIIVWPSHYNDNKKYTHVSYGVTVNMNGTIEKTKSGIFVQGYVGGGNGGPAMNQEHAPVVNVGGSITATGFGVQMSGTAVVNVSGTVNAPTAIGVKHGYLNVKDRASITATGAKVDPAQANLSGAEDTGAAISVTPTYNATDEIIVNVEGGTVHSVNNSALYLGHSVDDSTKYYFRAVELSVSGGTLTSGVTTNDAVYVAPWESGDTAVRPAHFISGGTFSSKPDASYIAQGLVTKQVDGMYTVGEPVAKIGSVNYATLKEALDAVKDTETIELTKDGAFNVIINNGRTFNLDLGKHTLTGYIDLYRGFVTLKNGTVKGTVYVNGGTANDVNGGTANDPTPYNSLTVAEDATIESHYAVILYQSSDKNTAYGSTINVAGKLKGNLWVMGNIKDGNSEINVTGKVDATDKSDVGIALNGHATLNVLENADVKSDSTGIEVRAGMLNVSGGTIAGTGDYTVEPNSSGTTTSGAGIAVAQHTTKLDTGVSITGGTISGTMGLSIANPQNNTTGVMNVSVTGGDISAVDVYGKNGKSVINSDFRVSGFIMGGTFSDDPNAAYVADGYKSVKQTNDRYEVGKAEVTKTVVENPTDTNTRTYKVSTDVFKTDAETGNATSANLETKSNQEITVTGTTTEAEVAAVTTQNSTVSQAAGAIALDKIQESKIDTVVMAALASAGAQATSVSSVKIAIVKDSGTEKKDDSSNKVTKVTYDVHPEAIAYVDNNAVGSTKITNEQLANNVTYSFKLPVPNVLATTGTVKVTHISEGYDDDVQTLGVEGNTGNYYVTVTATHFSDFVLEEEDLGTLASSNLALGGMTIMNYYFIPNGAASFENVTAKFTIANTGRTVEVSSGDWKDYTVGTTTYKQIECPLYAQEITSNVSFSLLNGEQTAKFAIVGSAHMESYSDSIKDYWTRYENNLTTSISTTMETLRDKMLAYGEYTCYALNKSGTITHTLSDPSISAIDGAENITQTGYRGMLVSISMALGSGTSMYLYIVNDGEYTFTDASGKALDSSISNGYYLVKSADVAAHKYDEQQTIFVKEGSTVINEIQISVNKCIDLSLKNSAIIGERTLNVCRAIYEYGLATKAALEAN